MDGRPTIPVLAATLVAGCSEGWRPPALEYETQRAVIGVEPDRWKPLCRGDLRIIDETVAAIESRLGVERDEVIEIYLMDSEDMPCADGTQGCYSTAHDQVFATWSTLPHELVHAITKDVEFPSKFWQEGVAEAANGTPSWKGTLRAITEGDLEADSLMTYRTAAHFNRFLAETYGWESYRRVALGQTSLPDELGAPTSEILDAYEASAPFGYPAIDPCPFPTLPEIAEGTWSESLTLDCDADDATQFEWVTHSRSDGGVAVVRSLELAAGTYAVELEGGVEVVALACAADELTEDNDPPTNGDLFNQFDHALGTSLPAGGEHVLTLTDGTYRFAVTSGTQDVVSARLTVRRLD